MKLFLKILFFIFTMFIVTVGEVQSSTVVNILQKETSYSFYKESQFPAIIFKSYYEESCLNERNIVTYYKWGISVEGNAAKGGMTGIRQVGKYLESVDDVFANPNLLKGQSPAQVQGVLGKTSGWQVETLGKGAHQGQGMILREYGTNSYPTGRMIQWHPGGGHHGPNPYWKVSSGAGTFRIF